MLLYIAKKERDNVDNIQKNIKNNDGSIETILIKSNDNYKILDINKTYKLIKDKENKITNTFKNSILGSEIGIKAEGFSTIAILATIIAVGMFFIMYMFCKI